MWGCWPYLILIALIYSSLEKKTLSFCPYVKDSMKIRTHKEKERGKEH